MTELAVLSLHSSPLAQPGVGDSGGMNVYVRELAASLAQAGVGVTVYVRRWHPGLADEVRVEPGFRVRHLDAGPVDLPKEALPEVVDEFTEALVAELERRPADVVHANYWLSGVVGHRVKHRLDLPLVSTFHTLARVKAETGDPEPQRRIEAESEVVGCSDVILANAEEERSQLVRLYGADPSRVEIVPPGVEHAFFSPGDRVGARTGLGLDSIDALELAMASALLAGDASLGMDLVVRAERRAVDGTLARLARELRTTFGARVGSITLTCHAGPSCRGELDGRALVPGLPRHAPPGSHAVRITTTNGAEASVAVEVKAGADSLVHEPEPRARRLRGTFVGAPPERREEVRNVLGAHATPVILHHDRDLSAPPLRPHVDGRTRG